MIIDLFAGPGGWEEGLRDLDAGDVVGLEWDNDACDTAEAAGHKRARIDVAAAKPSDYGPVRGIVASPPCQAFSTSGKQEGRRATQGLLDHIRRCEEGWEAPPATICGDDVRADLTLQPLRWVDALRPRWVACEQVPAVAPLWEAIAKILRGWGYSATSGVLNAADFGVPQTRRRAVLVASLDAPVALPSPTHVDARQAMPLFQLPWVSMVESLGWLSPEGARIDPPPGFVVDELDEWSLMAGGIKGAGRPRPLTLPSPTLTGKGASYWVKASSRPVRVTVEQSACIQGFRLDYPWQGTSVARYQQVGNAVPPPLATAVAASAMVGA